MVQLPWQEYGGGDVAAGGDLACCPAARAYYWTAGGLQYPHVCGLNLDSNRSFRALDIDCVLP